MKLLVCLGNVGREYEKTRHNVGFEFADILTQNIYLGDKFNSTFARLNLSGHDCFIIKPTTYMNLSGKSVLQWKSFYKIHNKDIFIFYDDVDVGIGKMRIKTAGSSGGHNGIKSIDSSIGQDYNRIRIGVGKCPEGRDLSNYVLGKFSQEEYDVLTKKLFILKDNLGLVFSMQPNDLSIFLKMVNG